MFVDVFNVFSFFVRRLVDESKAATNVSVIQRAKYSSANTKY